MSQAPLYRHRVPLTALLFIGAGAASPLLWSDSAWRQRIWLSGLIVTGAPLVYKTIRGVFNGRFAADLVASLTVVGSLLLGQPVVGLIIVLMQSGGEALEKIAEGRAANALKRSRMLRRGHFIASFADKLKRLPQTTLHAVIRSWSDPAKCLAAMVK